MNRLITLGCLSYCFFTMVGHVSAAPIPKKPKASLTFTGVPKHPTVHQEVTFQLLAENVKLDEVKVVVTYRPGSRVTVKKELEVPPDGVLKWKPEHEGIVKITAMKPKKDKKGKVLKDKSGNVIAEVQTVEDCAVRFDGLPVYGVIIFVVAFVVLFGGMAYAFIRGS